MHVLLPKILNINKIKYPEFKVIKSDGKAALHSVLSFNVCSNAIFYLTFA